jgi:hypothetical protein
MAHPTNLLVFRDVSEELFGRSLALRLRQGIAGIQPGCLHSVVAALITAGEFECALADSGWRSASEAASITDVLARAFVAGSAADLSDILHVLSTIEHSLPESVRVSHPEGFSYYAVHPADFAESAVRRVGSGSVGVIGIRSIGTTLGAVCMAALATRGLMVSRCTVRPVGHPYDRRTEFSDTQQQWVRQQQQRGGTFLIVDEGPGLSGSSFLSVAEALENCGISPSRIVLLGTRDAGPVLLCARDAARRWPRYKWQKAESTIARACSQQISLSGGSWRNELLGCEAEWPACWPEMEALKSLSLDREHVFKFEGLGTHGERAHQRVRALFDAGFSPRPEQMHHGMTRYDFISGCPLNRSDVSTEVLNRMAEYCAFRVSNFQTPAQPSQLTQMVRFNLSQEMAVDFDLPPAALECESPVIADCRMQPHEWIRTDGNKIMKFDGAADGEGHFLPGPTDISWDLAGTIVEWNLNGDAETYFLGEFRKRGSRISDYRLSWFVLAYSVFRLSYCKMARASTQDLAEKGRLDGATLYYRRMVHAALQRLSASCLKLQG